MDTLDELLRARLDPVGDWHPTTLRHAAVLCPIVAGGSEVDLDHVLFVVRPDDLRQHPGQVAFPGGMADHGESPLQTALRECREEIGVASSALTVLGSLPPRESSSGILVQCLIARMLPVPLVPELCEVAALLRVPLAALRDDSLWHDRAAPPTASGRPLRINNTGHGGSTSPHFRIGDYTLWGLTARFVRDLTARLG